jgi:hypothetical protein
VISAVVGGDRLPCSVSYCILVHGSESWTLVTAEHIRSAEDLHDCLVLFLSRVRNPLDSKFQWSGDVEVVQQIPQPAGGDWSFISDGLDLVGVAERLVFLDVTQRSVVFIIFAFNLIALFFFFFLIDLFLPMIVVVVIIPRQLLNFLRVFSCRYRDHNLKGVLLLRNVLRGVGLRLWRRWYIPRRQLSSGLISSALPDCMTRTNQLKFGNRRE